MTRKELQANHRNIARPAVARAIPAAATALAGHPRQDQGAWKWFPSVQIPPARSIRPSFDLPELRSGADRPADRTLSRAPGLLVDYKRGVTDVAAMTDLPKGLRAAIEHDCRISTPVVVAREKSSGRHREVPFQLADGRIESVFILDTPAMTFCISTQVGAPWPRLLPDRQDGARAHPTAGEIAGQVRALHTRAWSTDKTFNIVLMGMGEPLHKYDGGDESPAHPGNDEHGLLLSQTRHHAVHRGLSLHPEKLGREELMPAPAILAHAPNRRATRRTRPHQQELRGAASSRGGANDSRPVAQSHHLRIRDARAGENDSVADAKAPARLLAGVKAKVNLIPPNAAGWAFRSSVPQTEASSIDLRADGTG